MTDSESNSSDNTNEIVSKEIREAAQQISLDLLPDKSKRLYTIAYNGFKKWRRDNKTNSFCEDVILAYFAELSKKYASTSLWSTYSMLKTTINAYDKIDISKYSRLNNYLKKQSRGYIPKKSAVFEKEHISKFLSEAPDSEYLCEKYVGKWYKAERYVSSIDSDWKCVSQTYTDNKNKPFSVDYNQISSSNNVAISMYGTVKQDNADKAKLTNIIQIITTDWIVDTDYKSYAVVNSCLGGTRIVHIFTRAQQPEAAVFEKAYQALDKNKIMRTSFKPTDQKTCPK